MANPANINYQMNQARFVSNSAVKSNVIRPIAMCSQGITFGMTFITTAAGVITDAVYPIGVNSTNAYAPGCHLILIGVAVATINAYINQGTLAAPSFAVLSDAAN